jgi:glucoside 3-dehydrogenase (cytochrome c) hitch-hiker subunit
MSPQGIDNRLRRSARDRMIVPMSQVPPAHSSNVTRRTALKAFGAGVGAAALLPWLSDEGLLAFSRIQATNAAPAPKLLSKSQYATLETLAEAIIPTDERSPGAKQARVADYIDLLLSESDADVALQWLGGLAALDAEASARFNAPFIRLNGGQLDAILRDISRNETEPQTPLERFFAMTKQATIQGYYTSEIGIHQELRYKGNKFLREFVGCETEDGKDCQYCGQKDTKGTKDTKAPGRQR